MKNFIIVITGVILVSMPFATGALAYGDKGGTAEKTGHYTYLDAAEDDLKEAVVLGVSANAVEHAGSFAKNLTSHRVFHSTAAPRLMSDAEIDQTLKKIAGHGEWGRGQFGGANVAITYDGGQFDRSIARQNLLQTWGDGSALNKLSGIMEQFSGGAIREGTGPLEIASDVRNGDTPNPQVVDDALVALSKTDPEFRVIHTNSYQAGIAGITDQLKLLNDANIKASVKEIVSDSFAGRVASRTLGAASSVLWYATLERSVAGVGQGFWHWAVEDERNHYVCDENRSGNVNCGNTILKNLFTSSGYNGEAQEKRLKVNHYGRRDGAMGSSRLR